MYSSNIDIKEDRYLRCKSEYRFQRWDATHIGRSIPEVMHHRYSAGIQCNRDWAELENWGPAVIRRLASLAEEAPRDRRDRDVGPNHQSRDHHTWSRPAGSGDLPMERVRNCHCFRCSLATRSHWWLNRQQKKGTFDSSPTHQIIFKTV